MPSLFEFRAKHEVNKAAANQLPAHCCLLLVVQENKLKFRKIVFLHKINKMSTHFSVKLLDIDCKLYFMILLYNQSSLPQYYDCCVHFVFIKLDWYS